MASLFAAKQRIQADSDDAKIGVVTASMWIEIDGTMVGSIVVNKAQKF